MATAALLSITPAQLLFPPSPAASSPWPSSAAMPMARPKSAKGRSRTSSSVPRSGAPCPCPALPAPLLARGRAHPALQAGPEEIPELLQQVPGRSCSSLNRYPVLPSIGRRGAPESLPLSEGPGEAPPSQPLAGEGDAAGVLPGQSPAEEPGGESEQQSLPASPEGPREPPLLLAVRCPCGRRFQRLFRATDSLQMVLAAAERETATEYPLCSIHTLDLPPRSFSDLGRTLRECGILHRSVLCIRR
ncbi:UBX10 protein, partial [Alcedo cyanopectus]|nr:UBX10 protein [Ceyx cyanopectus]